MSLIYLANRVIELVMIRRQVRTPIKILLHEESASCARHSSTLVDDSANGSAI